MKKHWIDNPQGPDAAPREAAPTRVPARFAIGPVEVRPATVLAPMAGVTDTIFRRFIRNASLFSPAADADATVDTEISNQQSGCGLIMTEFTSADGLARMREAKRKRYLTYYDDEHPIAAQLFGSDPRTLSEAARIVQDAGFDMVDLNLGCPAKRVVACNGGSGLLRDLPLMKPAFFEAVRGAVTTSLHREVPPWVERRQHRLRPARASRGAERTQRSRAARTHAGAGLLGRRSLGAHCRRKGRGRDSGDRQRRASSQHPKTSPLPWWRALAVTP